MKLRNVSIFLAVTVLLAPALAGQEKPAKKDFLTPAEFLKIMNESKISYWIQGLDKLKPEEAKDPVGLLIPESCPRISNPVLEDKNGRITVKEFPFKIEALELIRKAEPDFQAKNYDAALKLYEQALQIDPDCYMATVNIGDCYYFGREPEKALAEYDKALLKNPNDHRVHFFRGNALLAMGRIEEARASYIRSLTLRPRYAYALQVLNARQEDLKIKVRDSLFHPPLLVRKEGEGIAVYIDTEKAGAPWMAYAMAKAVWLGEPSHRRDMTGKDDAVWSSIEERECLSNLLSVYINARRNNEIPADDDLEVLQEIFLNGDLDGFIMYEIYTRYCPYALLMLPDETREGVKRFIQKYMVVATQ